MTRRPIWILLSLVLGACSGNDLSEGLGEPVRVADAQFMRGALPGLPPLDRDEIESGVKPVSPRATSITSPSRIIKQGAAELSVSGRTSRSADAIGIALAGEGSGYWVVPVGAPDLQFDAEPTWHFTAALAPSVQPGVRRLLVSAIDANGNSGTQGTLDVCVAPLVPDNLNACVPTQKPPLLVVSLTWDRKVDLDLGVVTPRGKFVSAKDPSTVIPDADGKVVVDKRAGVIDVDANAACSGVGGYTENLVFQERPEAGNYLVYVNLFDACGQDSARFNVSLHAQAKGAKAGTYTVKTLREQAGIVGSHQANAGSGHGSFVTQFKVP